MNVEISSDLWASTMAPEGILERWLIADGSSVTTGEALLEVRVEDALHDVIAPASGRLVQLLAKNGLVEPGSIVGRIDGTREAS